MHVEPSKPIPAPRRRKTLLRVFVAVAALVVAVMTAEFALRWVLAGEGVGWRLRNPSLYADPRSDDDFWKLHRQFRKPSERDGFARRDARLGWLDADIEPATYAHVDEARVSARRPILLFGDSYAACVTSREECWEGLVDDDPELRETHVVVNYGTAAFGVDQAFVLLREALPRWQARDPLVVFTIFVDDDLDRCALTFRGCPKPWFEVGADGELVEHPPLDIAIDAYVAEHPLEIASYLARLVLMRFPGVLRVLPSALRPPHESEPALIEHKQRVVRALLVEFRALLDATSTDAFVVLFHGER